MIAHAVRVTEKFGPEGREAEIGDVVNVAVDAPFLLDCGREIRDVPLAFQTYGTLNAGKDNAILIFHPLTCDQYVCGAHPVTGRPGWWERAVGPGKALDADKYFVICANVIGGCMGSFGPKTIDPETDKPYGVTFPVVTIRDMASIHKPLLDMLGIKTLHALVGASLGGMMALEWALLYPDSLRRMVLVASGFRQSPQNIAFNEIGRQAVMADPEWRGGRYLEEGTFPAKGLAVGRMSAHVTFLSPQAIEEKFGRGFQHDEGARFGFDADFRIESYLRHQGMTFVDRFDPNSYLYLSRATDYFDVTKHGTKKLPALLAPLRQSALTVISFSSDWRCPTEEARRITHAAMGAGLRVSGVEIATDKGHDAFLLDEPAFYDVLAGAVAS
ncbi:MAG: homoserine O-acetyltransferase [Rickettsiales bacterium]